MMARFRDRIRFYWHEWWLRRLQPLKFYSSLTLADKRARIHMYQKHAEAVSIRVPEN